MHHLRPPLLLAVIVVATSFIVACASSPVNKPPQRTYSEEERVILNRAAAFQLVSVEQAVPGIWVEQRYKSERNVIGTPFYPRDLPCLVHRDTAVKLAKAQKLLLGRGYQLKIWDAYRPAESHMVLWKKFGMSGYVHEPGHEGRWSWHCYGRAVDVTLLDLHGREQVMPTDFDDFTPKAWAGYRGGDDEIATRVRILQWAMQKAGLEYLNSEWWHFSDPVEGPVGVPMMASDLGIGLPAMPYEAQKKKSAW